MKYRSSIGVMVFLLILLSSCTTMMVNERKQQLNDIVQPLLGANQDQVISVLGIPSKVEMVGSYEVYIYYKSYGNRINSYGSVNAYGRTAYGSSMANTWESYDLIRCYFMDNIMVKWDGYVQR